MPDITEPKIKRVTKELINPISWFRIILAVVILYGVYKLMSKPTQNIIAKRGSNVQVTQVNKTSRFFIPFIEAGVEQRRDSDMGTFIRGGLRIEF